MVKKMGEAKASSKKRLYMLSVLLAMTVGVACMYAPHHPAYNEWRFSRQSLAQLLPLQKQQQNNPVYLFYTSKQLLAAGHPEDAEKASRLAVQIAPDEARQREQWVDTLLATGQDSLAQGAIREFLARNPNSPAAHFLLGRYLVTQNVMDKAIEELTRAIDLDPKHGYAYMYLAIAHEDLRELPVAVEKAHKSVEIMPAEAQPALILGSLLQKTNRSPEARLQFLRAKELSPDDSHVMREVGRFLLEHGTQPQDRPEAKELLEKSYKKDIQDTQAAFLVARLYLEEKKYAEALPLLNQVETSRWSDPLVAKGLRDAYLGLNKSQDASLWDKKYQERTKIETDRRLVYEQLRVDPKKMSLHQKMAVLMAQSGDVKNCLKQFAVVQKRSAEDASVLIAGANALTDAGFPQESLALAHLALDKTQSNPYAHEALGNAYLKLDRLIQAGQAYQMASGLLPSLKPILEKKVVDYNAKQNTNSPAYQAIQRAFEKERYYFGRQKIGDDVIAEAKIAVGFEPRNTTYLAYLLRLYMNRGEQKQAIEISRKLLELAPDDWNVHVRLGILLLETASTEVQQQEAEKHLRSAMDAEMLDNKTVALREYGFGLLYLARKQGEDAAAHLKQAATVDPEPAITYYKLAQAEQMAGHDDTAKKSLDYFNLLQKEAEEEHAALRAIADAPNNADLYKKAVALLQEHGKNDEASAVGIEAKRRFALAH
jgi:tetratricopeptide (TPR) repeat protein